MRGRSVVWRPLADQYGLLALVLLVSVSVANAISPGILSLGNFSAMTTFGVEIGLLAFGETVIILGGGGGIDLSVGSMFAVSQVVVAVLVEQGADLWLAVGAGIASGLIMGSINGWLVTRVRIPAIITTLATMYAYSGTALLLTNGIDISNFPAAFNVFGQGIVLGLPFQFVAIYVPVAIILWFALTKTLYGYRLYLTGTNQTAAILSGIDVNRVRMGAYVLTGLLCSLAGIIDASRLATARPDAGLSANLEAITIAVLGGTSIFGGRGTIGGTVMATLVITLLGYSFSLANINSVIETGTVGLILIAVVLGQHFVRRWTAAVSPRRP